MTEREELYITYISDLKAFIRRPRSYLDDQEEEADEDG